MPMLRPSLAISLALLAAACATAPKPSATRPGNAGADAPAVPPGVKIGRPYTVFGRTYHPSDDRDYDEKGIASWYGPDFHGRSTANGEIYNQDDLTAAHRTLPMPSWVEVTNLDNGRKLTVRINDRGPFADRRIIDLSRRSAQLLGVYRPGLARVRVRRVFPEGDWARTTPATRIAAVAPSLLPAPLPAVTPTAADDSFIQVAALSDEGRAMALASALGDFGPAAATPAPGGLWRVRIGPLAAGQAESLLQQVRAAGYPDAWLLP